MARERKVYKKELYARTKSILLTNGYDGFTFSILAEQLDVARGTLYKYYENKDELITEFMVHEMEAFLEELKEIDQIRDFKDKFDFLIATIFRHNEVQQFIVMSYQIPKRSKKRVKENLEQVEKLHLKMYDYLQAFVTLGKQERLVKKSIPDGLILGFIFQSIAIPNHFGVPHKEWVESMKEIICHGMFTSD